MPLQKKMFKIVTICAAIIVLHNAVANAQENSPLSRFGMGDIVPNSHQVLRAMGGLTAGIGSAVTNGTFINNANPASYAYLAYPKGSKVLGRTILDIGVDYVNHTIKSTTPVSKYSSNGLVFSYVQVGIPLDTPQRWGLTFGLKPYTNISYNVNSRIKVFGTDSLLRQFEGSGGSYKGFIGTGYRFGGLSLGFNTGYIFGKKNFATRNAFINDSVITYPGNFETKTNFGNAFLETGLLYTHKVNKTDELTFGFTYNLETKLKATKDVIKETFRQDPTTGLIDSLDRLKYLTNNKGTVVLPSSYTIGFTYERSLSDDVKVKKPSWMIGAQYETSQWSKYNFYGSSEGLVNSSTIRLGGFYYNPYSKNVNKKASLINTMIYRLGYYNTKGANGLNNVKQSAVTFGVGVPLSTASFYNSEVSFLNLSFEVGSRKGLTNFNESFFRIGAGFSLSDIWFIKRKYN
jgi:hypothetical protein